MTTLYKFTGHSLATLLLFVAANCALAAGALTLWAGLLLACYLCIGVATWRAGRVVIVLSRRRERTKFSRMPESA